MPEELKVLSATNCFISSTTTTAAAAAAAVEYLWWNCQWPSRLFMQSLHTIQFIFHYHAAAAAAAAAEDLWYCLGVF